MFGINVNALYCAPRHALDVGAPIHGNAAPAPVRNDLRAYFEKAGKFGDAACVVYCSFKWIH